MQTVKPLSPDEEQFSIERAGARAWKNQYF
jgi:hypothetical protein